MPTPPSSCSDALRRMRHDAGTQEGGRTDGRRVSEPVTVAGIRAAIEPVLRRLAEEAPRRDRERDLPYADIRELAQRRLLLLRLPRADGGAGGSVRELFEVAIDIARADSSAAQALRNSMLTSNQAALLTDPVARARLVARIRAGHLFSGTVNERGGASGAVDTRIRREGDGFVVTGAKYYSTGGLYADWFSGTATDEDGQVVHFTVPTDRAGVERLDDFDAVGQRLTASGSTRLHDVRLTADEVTPVRATRNPAGHGAQLFLAAVEAGIAAAARDDAIRVATECGEAAASGVRAVDDPHVRHAVGEISARAQAARAGVLLAAETVEAAWGRLDDEDGLNAASVTVAETQFVAIESALRCAELVFDVGGGEAISRERNLDRHWRNARTVANHNPRSWKAGVIGGYRLVGETPPTSGLF